jgi:polar amino acid transport system substrate-binding protein
MVNVRTLRLHRRQLMMGGVALLAAQALFAQPAFAITPAEIKARGKLIVGILRDNPPWGFIEANRNPQGFDAEIAELFGKELGVPVEFVPLTATNRIPALTLQRLDILFATMVMLPDRAQAVQYSEPYVATTITLVAAKTVALNSYADMAKFTIGVQRATIQDVQVTKNAPPGTKIVRLKTEAATIEALISGEVQAIGGNMFYVERLNKAKPGIYEDKLEFMRLYNGACTRLGEKEINAAVNAFIDKIRGNGDLAKAYAKWLKVPVPSFPVSLEGVPFVAN